jgi:tetratricopeptide (TPR) repeat protein
MFENEILSTGELFKKYIHMLRVSQKDLCNGICSAANLTYIKKDIQQLTLDLAIKFADRFNQIARDKEIQIEEITSDSLLATLDDRANVVFMLGLDALEKIKRIEDLNEFEKEVSELEDFIKKYKIETINKINFYLYASDYYYIHYKYSKSELMCKTGLEHTSSEYILEKASFYMSKCRVKVELGFLDDALAEIEYAEMLNNYIENKSLRSRILFNKAKIYKKQEKLNEAIKILEELVGFDLDSKKEIEVKVMLANCLIDNKEYAKAVSSYIHILELAMNSNDKDLIAISYRNMAEINYKEDNCKEALKNMIESLNNNPGNCKLSENLYFTSNVLKKLNLDREEYLLRALSISEQSVIEDNILIEKIIYELITIYIGNEDDDKIDLLMKKIFLLDLDHSLICPLAIEYYRYRNDEKSVEYNTKQIDYIKKIKKI